MSGIIVEYHPRTFEEFFLEPLKDFPNLAEDLKADFFSYKAHGELPSTFGRDASYTQPYSAYKAHLMHIHLKLPPETFPENLPQDDRKCTRRKDAAIVYVQGELEENLYCILGVLYPNAHAKAREDKIMRYLARLAQEFRDAH
ncbi:mRNA interferase YafO [Halopseudomonas litoralis]|uniref:mRNA interferase YafO n=1 Tax=Halopseudomonas litoralis TaxID=797277 RepID=A0A1H1NY85_9GAMM|nr:type II toxin-antitoxin system YafO family toxin [Halopseudomonas litoralis]SDS03750.1 mRNA interferase YafO [Halopseudomonas litoralis]